MIPGNKYYITEDIMSGSKRGYRYAARGEQVTLVSSKDHVAIVEHEKTGRFSLNVAKLSEKDPLKVERPEAKVETSKPLQKVTFKEFKQAMKKAPAQPKQSNLF